MKMSNEEIKDFIANNYLEISKRELARITGKSRCFINNELKRQNLTIPKNIIEARRLSTQFKKGHAPINKGKKQHEFMSPEAIERTKATRFQKGGLPHNTKYDLAVSVRTQKDGRQYYWIRIRTAHWVLLHRYLFELVNGPIPKGHLVQFKDGDSCNLDLDNLYLTTRNKQANVNKKGGHKIPYEMRETINLIYQLKAEIDAKQNSRPQ